jgi:hypothetical protein
VRLCLDFQAWVVGRSVWNLLRALDREVEYLPFPVLGGLMSSWRSFSGFPALKTNAFRWYRCFVCFPLLLQDAKFRKKKRIAGRRAWATGHSETDQLWSSLPEEVFEFLTCPANLKTKAYNTNNHLPYEIMVPTESKSPFSQLDE